MDSEEDSSVLCSSLNDVTGDDDSSSTSFEYVESYDEENKGDTWDSEFINKELNAQGINLDEFSDENTSDSANGDDDCSRHENLYWFFFNLFSNLFKVGVT